MQSKKVRVRFAPSPTGALHIGGVRTALYNYLFARKHNGDFLLRIEDTDQNRYVEGAEKYIIDSLMWCGLIPDEGPDNIGGNYGPYRQSERKEIYKKYALELIEKNSAYYAFDTPEELDRLREEAEKQGKVFIYNCESRKHLKNSLTLSKQDVENRLNSGKDFVIRFLIPENQTLEIEDIIRGKIKVNTKELDDKVLYKSDGMPTYHLANIVDDHLMEITHVIRGEEWLPSMPLHVLLYKGFGWQAPNFAHLPLILKPEGSGKLSKRDGDKLGFPVFPMDWHAPTGETYSGYKEQGYLKDAFLNMLALLGWNDSSEKEIYSIKELIDAFSLEKVGKSGSRFDPKKTLWFQQEYLKKLSDEEFYELAKTYLPKTNETLNLKICSLVKDRCVFPKDVQEQSAFFFDAPKKYDEVVIKKRWKESTPNILLQIIDILKASKTKTEKHDAVMNFIKDNSLNTGDVMNCLRLCLVGAPKGPDLFEIIELLGENETENRIKKAVSEIKN